MPGDLSQGSVELDLGQGLGAESYLGQGLGAEESNLGQGLGAESDQGQGLCAESHLDQGWARVRC